VEEFYALYHDVKLFGQTGIPAVDSLTDLNSARQLYAANPQAYVADLVKYVRNQHAGPLGWTLIQIKSLFRGGFFEVRGMAFWVSVLAFTIIWNAFLFDVFWVGILPYNDLAWPLLKYLFGQPESPISLLDTHTLARSPMMS